MEMEIELSLLNNKIKATANDDGDLPFKRGGGREEDFSIRVISSAFYQNK